MNHSTILTLAILATTTTAVPAMGQPQPIDYTSLDKVVRDELKETNTPGAAVAIVSGDRVVYAKGFGTSNIETGTPVVPEMLFRTGSICKMLTAAVLVSLSEQGRINLQKPIGDYVKGLSPRLSQVTAHQLLSHTAGLIDPARVCCAQDESALATQVRAWRDEDYFFTEPGRIFSYSNSGYIVAGYLIEELTGQRYADAMRERLFKPLGMTHTTFRPTEAMTFPISQGHEANDTTRPTVKRPAVNNTGDWPAGFAYTNVYDYARFAIAFLNHGRLDGKQVLSPTLIETLSTAYAEVPCGWNGAPGFLEGAKYGYGLFIQKHRGLPLLHHGGIILGFGAFIALVPERRFGVIVLANKTGSVLSKTVEQALEVAFPLQPAPPRPSKVVPMTAAEMTAFSGTYRNGGLRIDLVVRDGKLNWKETYPGSDEEGPGHEFEAAITKTGNDRFIFTAPGESAPTDFMIIPGPTGKPEYLHTRLESAKRIDSPIDPRGRK